jgi:hypothetical protein
MRMTRRSLAIPVLVALVWEPGAPPAHADDGTAAGRRQTDWSTSAQTKVQLVQFGASSHYPFARPPRAYRYPFNYPYYRYSPRHYPFGNGPYGPYNSNYGGYTGNAFDVGVYGNGPPPNGFRPNGGTPPPDDDEPGPPPGAPRSTTGSRAPIGPRLSGVPTGDGEDYSASGNGQEAPAVAPPAASAPLRPINVLPPPLTSQQAEILGQTGGVPAGPPPGLPRDPQIYGEPVPYSGNSPFNPSHGGGRLYQWFPHAYFQNDMWFGSNRLLQGFGYYPLQNYNYVYGPPSGLGFYSPPSGFYFYGSEFMPQYYNYAVRNFGPYYPGLGGVNNGAGFFQGGN